MIYPVIVARFSAPRRRAPHLSGLLAWPIVMPMRYAMSLALVLLSLPAIGREAQVNDTGGDPPLRAFREEFSRVNTAEAVARPVRFERIIDADTFTGGEPITIWGIDLPDNGHDQYMAAASDDYYGYEQDLTRKESRGIWQKSVSRSR